MCCFSRKSPPQGRSAWNSAALMKLCTSSMCCFSRTLSMLSQSPRWLPPSCRCALRRWMKSPPRAIHSKSQRAPSCVEGKFLRICSRSLVASSRRGGQPNRNATSSPATKAEQDTLKTNTGLAVHYIARCFHHEAADTPRSAHMRCSPSNDVGHLDHCWQHILRSERCGGGYHYCHLLRNSFFIII